MAAICLSKGRMYIGRSLDPLRDRPGDLDKESEPSW